VERWTQERRRQHTRELLLDAAEEVFAARGFEGASLDEIADTAGYTRGAIYKHFADKEDLFLAVNKRFNERFLTGFLDLIDPGTPPAEMDLALIAKRWHDLQTPSERAFGLGMEFSLYVLRNPQVRDRVIEQRHAVAEMIAHFIQEQADRLGATLRIPARTLARITLATGDGLQLAMYLDQNEDDLYEPFLELLLSAWEMPAEPVERQPRPMRPGQPPPGRPKRRLPK
jgi:AcrR family transcriptional regulator